MSAIWGVINLSGNSIVEHKPLLMMDEISKYKIDEISYMTRENFFIGCGKQYITKESVNEVLPYFDKKENLYIVADAIIDNTEELFHKLNLKNREHEISDSFLILESYKKWGEDCCKYLIGDFTFVIIDNGTVFVSKDHCGHRSLYYSFIEDEFVFSTTLNPMRVYFGEEIKVKEEWLAGYLMPELVKKNNKFYDTVYEDIYVFPTATTLTLREEKRSFKKYWNPLEYEELKFINEEQCFNEFRKLFREAVRCRLRTIDEVGIMLSGGLDSSSVAAFAAMELKNKILRAYTFVPFTGYINKEKSYLIPNEKEYVDEIIKMYPNIDLNLCTGYHKDSIEVVDQCLKNIEQPYIAIENAGWLSEGVEKAKNQKCKVILTGQFGNLSVSYGGYYSNIKTLLEEKKYLSILKEAMGVSKISGRKTSFILKNTINYMKKCNEKEAIKNNGLIKEEFFCKFRNDEIDIDRKIKNFEEMKKVRIENLFTNNVGSIDTVLGLNSALVFRDPTKDKRIVEFCIRLKNSYFVNRGKERFLIRESMKNLIPEKIRNNYKKRGVQGADWTQRLIKNKEKNYEKLNLIFSSSDIKNFINYKEVKRVIDALEEGEIEENSQELKLILKLYVIFKFLK